MPQSKTRSVRTRRAKAVDFALGMTIFWAVTAYTFFASGGRNNGTLLLIFSVVAIATWTWAIITIRSQQAAGKNLAELQALFPDVFEDWTAARFRDLGYSVKTTGTSGDHGVDLVVEKDGHVGVVQCKNYKSWSIGEPILRDLYGAMHDYGADRAFLVTSGRLTQAAASWVEGKPIEVWDGERLVALSAAMRKTPGHRGQEITAAVPATGVPPIAEATQTSAEPASATVICPKCGSPLIERKNRKTGEVFLGCSGYPKCRYTMPL